MARIKIKCPTHSRTQKLKLMEILFTREIEVSRILESRDGFVSLVNKELHVDNIFTTET